MADFRFRLVLFAWFAALTCFGLVCWSQPDGDGFYLCTFVSGATVLLLLALIAIQDIRHGQRVQRVEERANDYPGESPPG